MKPLLLVVGVILILQAPFISELGYAASSGSGIVIVIGALLSMTA